MSSTPSPAEWVKQNLSGTSSIDTSTMKSLPEPIQECRARRALGGLRPPIRANWGLHPSSSATNTVYCNPTPIEIDDAKEALRDDRTRGSGFDFYYRDEEDGYAMDSSGNMWEDANDMFAYGDCDWGSD